MNDRSHSKLTGYFRGQSIFLVAVKLVAVIVILSIPFAGAIAQLAPRERRAATSNTVLVSSVFAAGTGGSAMTSTNFRMLGVLGEAGLPNNQTTLSSQNYQHQPGFLAAQPAQANSPSRLYLPLALRNYIQYFPGPFDIGPNNSAAQATGPLQSGVDYHGYPDDAKEYFSFYLLANGNITVDLTNPTGQGTELALYYQADLQHNITFAFQPPFHIALTNRPSGWYYVEVFTGSGLNMTTPYTLRVTYP